MDAIARLGSLLGLSFISGINLYATVAVTGLCVKYNLVEGLPAEFQVFANDAVIVVALFLYVIEFFMDKIQGLDTLWDTLHTIIRPLGGGFIALAQIGEASPSMEVIVFLLGASLASAAHVTKAGTRLVVNTSPEPVSNILVSVGEDVGVIGFSYLSLAYPELTFFFTLIFIALIFLFLPFVYRIIRMLSGSLLFRVKSFFIRHAAKEDFVSLPPELDSFFEEQRGDDEEIEWSGKAFAVRISSIPRYKSIYFIVTSLSVYVLFRRWFRYRIKHLERSSVQKFKCYPGKFLTRCLIRTSGETWIVQLYEPLMETLPIHPGLHNKEDKIIT